MTSMRGFFVVAALAAGMLWEPQAACAAPCTGWDWAYLISPGSCYFYTNLIVTAGPDDCKKAGSQRSEKTISCSGSPAQPGPKTCSFTRSSTTTTKYNLSGSITYEKWGGLSASYASETIEVVACNPNETIGPLNCSETPYPADQGCCAEAWETQRSTSKKIDVWGHFTLTDVGECNGTYTSGWYQCSVEGTLVEIISSDCSDCTDLAPCS